MAYTSYVVLDYGFFKKQILYKNNIRKNNYEENDKDGKRFFDDEIKKYNKLDDIEKDLYDRGFIELYELNTTNKELNKKRSIRRAKNNVYNISILNSWDYFITLTFSKELDGENMYENEFCYIKTVYKKEEIEKC